MKVTSKVCKAVCCKHFHQFGVLEGVVKVNSLTKGNEQVTKAVTNCTPSIETSAADWRPILARAKAALPLLWFPWDNLPPRLFALKGWVASQHPSTKVDCLGLCSTKLRGIHLGCVPAQPVSVCTVAPSGIYLT